MGGRDSLSQGLAFAALASDPQDTVRLEAPQRASGSCPPPPLPQLPHVGQEFGGQAGRLSLGPAAPSLLTPAPALSAELMETRRPLAHEWLGEALRVMRQVIGKYPLLNTVETLTAAGTLIAKVKGQPAKTGPQGLEGFPEEGMDA